jgi:hypothetical protein
MTKRQKFDPNAAGAQELRDRIVHGAFVTEGTMVAFPTCFPGVTIPLPADESHITALDATPDGIVYGGTSGRAAHLLVGMFHGVTGMVFDLGAVEGGDTTVAVCCGRKGIVAAVNGPEGGRLVARELEPLPFDLIQEWHIRRRPLSDLGPVAAGERIVHMVADAGRTAAVGVTAANGRNRTDATDAAEGSDRNRAGGVGAAKGHLFTFDFVSSKIEVVAEVPGRGRLGRTASGAILGPDEGATLWRFEPKTGRLERRALQLPAAGTWGVGQSGTAELHSATSRPTGRLQLGDPRSDAPSGQLGVPVGTAEPFRMRWALDPASGRLYVADGEGRIFTFTEEEGFGDAPVARTPVAPVGTMAVTLDGRLFGTYGGGMAKLFCYDPRTGALTSLGVAVSVFERRRYGYAFGDAVVGRDGEIVLGEDDDLGHLWLYFPRIRKG